MSDTSEHRAGAGPSQRAVEVGTAIVIAVFGLIVIVGSLRVGIGWGAEGPKSGFFPFYLGLAIVIASMINLLRVPFEVKPGTLFAEWPQLRQVLSVAIPTAVYVVVIPWTGLYIASLVLIAGFMMWLGKYRAPFSIGLSFVMIVAIYLTYEKWFLEPLPKGPIEDLLGL
jgi:putative tricarboxylic transport membrane protein